MNYHQYYSIYCQKKKDKPFLQTQLAGIKLSKGGEITTLDYGILIGNSKENLKTMARNYRRQLSERDNGNQA